MSLSGLTGKLFGKLIEWTNGVAYASFTDAIKEGETLWHK